jgi:serine/threonine protein kinase
VEPNGIPISVQDDIHSNTSCSSICRYEDVFLHELLQGYQKKLVVCIVMEFCEKGDLAGAIGYHRDRRTPIPEKQLAQWAKEIFEGLEYIHGAGVLHRDLKSPNIFIARNGSIKLGDFGLARQGEHICAMI